MPTKTRKRHAKPELTNTETPVQQRHDSNGEVTIPIRTLIILRDFAASGGHAEELIDLLEAIVTVDTYLFNELGCIDFYRNSNSPHATLPQQQRRLS